VNKRISEDIKNERAKSKKKLSTPNFRIDAI